MRRATSLTLALGALLLVPALPAVGAPGAAGAIRPALASDVHVEIAGVLAHTRLTQIFRNPTDHPLEAVYLFPLPAGAVVDGLSLAVGQRALRGRIVERETGEAAGGDALASGRKEATLSREGPDLVSISVGALAPGEEVGVVLDLVHPVTIENGRFTLRFPMVSRALPAGTEAGAGSTDPNDPADPTVGPARLAETSGLVNPFDLHVDLYPGVRLGKIESSSHTVRVAELGDPGSSGIRYTVDLDRAASADRDFVLSWEPVSGVAAQAALYSEEWEGERYVLLLALPPAGAAGLSDLSVRWDDAAAETWPRSLPDRQPGEPLWVAARLGRDASLAQIAGSAGRRGAQPWEVVLPLSAAAPARGIAKLWAGLKLATLESPEEITDLALRYGLLSGNTSLVVEDSVTMDVGDGPPRRAWVSLAEPAEPLVLRAPAAAAPVLPAAISEAPLAATVAPPARRAPAAVRARSTVAVRPRAHHRLRRRHKLHRRRRRARHVQIQLPPAPPAAEALTPRARLGPQAQRR
jgi:Vault protein inter-alpha-trypsin domain